MRIWRRDGEAKSNLALPGGSRGSRRKETAR
jgi:hypothetical protein